MEKSKLLESIKSLEDNVTTSKDEAKAAIVTRDKQQAELDKEKEEKMRLIQQVLSEQ